MLLFRKLKGRTVVINTTDGAAFQGTVSRVAWFVVLELTASSAFEVGSSGFLSVEGTVRIPARFVKWMQVL